MKYVLVNTFEERKTGMPVYLRRNAKVAPFFTIDISNAMFFDTQRQAMNDLAKHYSAHFPDTAELKEVVQQ